MHKRITLHAGLDVHKESIEIALADGTRGGEVRHYGCIGGDLASLDRAVRQLGGAQRELIFTYEAGPRRKGQVFNFESPKRHANPTRRYPRSTIPAARR